MDVGWLVGGGIGATWPFGPLPCCSFSSSLVFGQIEPTASSHPDEARPGLATFFALILIKLSAKLAESSIPDLASRSPRAPVMAEWLRYSIQPLGHMCVVVLNYHEIVTMA